MIISHTDKAYRPPCENGANIYSQLICKYFVPNIKTTRNWVTINVGKAADHSIVFIHSNLNTAKKYGYLKNYKDLILVCSQPSTCRAVENLGKTLYLPLSIDVDYVKSFDTHVHDLNTCYAGRKGKNGVDDLDRRRVDFLSDIPHEELLRRMSHYRYVYAVGLTALEAKVLGCNVLPYDSRFPDPSVWVVRDIKDMIPYFQSLLDKCEI